MSNNRRSHNLIDKLPQELKEAINNAIVNERLTYKEITEMINNAGHKVSAKTVERYGKKFISKLESITRAKEQAKSILETSAGLKLDMAEASSMMAFQLLMDMLVNASGEVPDKGTLNAIKTLASLERSAVGREKLKYQYDKGVNTAADRIKAELKQELQSDQELLNKLNSHIDRIATEITKA